MIDITQKKPTFKPEPVEKIAPVKVPFHLQDSIEADWIKEKIRANKEYLSKCQSKSLYQKVEKDTLYLENNILPIIQAKTNLYFSEAIKVFASYLDAAIAKECNSLVIYLPIQENYIDQPKAGIANCRKNKKFGSMGAAEIYLELVNMDGNKAPFQQIELNL